MGQSWAKHLPCICSLNAYTSSFFSPSWSKGFLFIISCMLLAKSIFSNLLLWDVLEEVKCEVLVTQLYPTLCDPLDHSPPVSSVHGILQSRIPEWIAILFSRGSFRPRDWTLVSRTAGRFLTVWATREAQGYHKSNKFLHLPSPVLTSSFFHFLKLKFNCFTMQC